MKICLYVGSFNPVTKAHLKIASDLLENKIIDFLYFLPVNSQKSNLIPIKLRIDMLNLVTNSKEKTLNVYNYSQTGFFNYDVLTKINKQITHLVLGSDLFLKFNNFSNYQEILKNYNLIIIKRDNINLENIINKYYLSFKDKMTIIKKNYQGSSTLARNTLNEDYLSKEVLAYIKENSLYN